MRLGDESGSTALEALIAIALLTIAGTAIAAGARNGVAALRRAQDGALASAAVLRLDDALREEARKVRFPYWRKNIAIEENGLSVSVPWYGGDEEKALDISIREKTLTVSGGDFSRTFSGIENGALSIVENGSGDKTGVEVRCTLNGRAIRLLAPFASRPIGKEEAR